MSTARSRERALRNEVAAMMKRAGAVPEMRYLVARLGTDGKRYVVAGCEDLTQHGVMIAVDCLRWSLDAHPIPHIRDYLPFGYLPGEREKLLTEERIIETK